MLWRDHSSVNLTIATLGPKGTDAHAVAASLSDNVVLCESFKASLETADRRGCAALIPCGCGSFEVEALDRWVDLHFEFGNRLTLLGMHKRATKTMCAAVHKDGPVLPFTVGIHPATLFFARKHFPRATIKTFETKVAAVEACAKGEIEGCVGSLDVVRSHGELRVVESFEAEMIWVLYAHKDILRHMPTG